MNNLPISVKYGLLICCSFLLYFGAMALLGLEQIVVLRFFNLVFLIGGIYLAVRAERNDSETPFTYYSGFKTGVATGSVAAISFAASMFIYLTAINPAFLTAIKEKTPTAQMLNPFTSGAIIAFELIMVSFLVTYIVMQFEKAKTAFPHA